MKQTWMIALLSFFFDTTSFCQTTIQSGSTYSIRGTVIDSVTQTELSYVTISLLEKGKKQPSETTLTNKNGYFEIPAFPNKSYRLNISYIGYKPSIVQLPNFTSTSINLGQIPIVSLAIQLKEVEVVSQKSIIEQDLDKISYNVDIDPESKSVSALEILRKVPLLSLDVDDNLLLNGNSKFRILINGKPSSLFLHNQSSIFKNMPAHMMKTIEVITVPSSKYETQGVGGIINIITYKKNIGGYTGDINVRVNEPKGITVNGNLTASIGKLSFSGNVGLSNTTNPSSTNLFYRIDKLTDDKLDQISIGNSDNRYQNIISEITYNLSNQSIITASYSTNKNNSSNHLTQQSSFYNTSRTLVEAYNNLNAGKDNSYGKDFNLSYQHNFKKNEARQITLLYKWIDNTNKSTSDFAIHPLLNYEGQVSTTGNNDGQSEHRLEVDYVHPIKKHTLETGIHTIFRNNNSQYFYKNLDTSINEFKLDTNQSNNYHYLEAVYAAYTSLYLKFEKWGLIIGGRLEQSKVDAYFISSSTKTQQNFFNLLPNITLSRKLRGISMLKLSYTQRIQRPDLYYLNPYIDLTNPYNISFGNPRLQAAQSHVFNLGYSTFKKKTSINIELFHQFTNNAIEQLSILGTDTITRTTYGNIGKNRNTSLSLSGTTTLLKRINISLNSMANYVQYIRKSNDKLYSNEGFTYNISGFVNYLYKDWRTSINMSYYAPNILVQGKTDSYIANSISVNKYFFKNKKVNLGISISNPFHKYRQNFTELDAITFYQLRESKNLIRRYTMSFNYRFTKVQSNNSKTQH